MWFICEKEGIAGATSVWLIIICSSIVLNVSGLQLIITYRCADTLSYTTVDVHSPADNNSVLFPLDRNSLCHLLVCGGALARFSLSAYSSICLLRFFAICVFEFVFCVYIVLSLGL